jgi:hypothetical protein
MRQRAWDEPRRRVDPAARAPVSRSLFGFILGLLQLEDARVRPIGDLGQNQQVVAPEALRRLPLPGGVAVDPGVERADRGW